MLFDIETIYFAHEFSVPTIKVSKSSVSEQKQYEKNLERRDNFLDIISLTWIAMFAQEEKNVF